MADIEWKGVPGVPESTWLALAKSLRDIVAISEGRLGDETDEQKCAMMAGRAQAALATLPKNWEDGLQTTEGEA